MHKIKLGFSNSADDRKLSESNEIIRKPRDQKPLFFLKSKHESQ